MGGWVGGVSPIQFYFGFLEFFKTLQIPLVRSTCVVIVIVVIR